MKPDLTTNRIALICLLCVAILMVIYYLCPYFFFSPLGIILLVPGALFFFIYAMRIFRPR